jgi:hypothetical protein
MTLLLSRLEYEQWLYAIPAAYSAVSASTLRFFTTSATTAAITGGVEFRSGYRLTVSELVDFAAGEILDYGYEIWREGEKLYWYDPQPHPDDPLLAETFPHHKHVHPDIKHHRVPALGLSFDRPNLPALIEEIMHAPDTR